MPSIMLLDQAYRSVESQSWVTLAQSLSSVPPISLTLVWNGSGLFRLVSGYRVLGETVLGYTREWCTMGMQLSLEGLDNDLLEAQARGSLSIAALHLYFPEHTISQTVQERSRIGSSLEDEFFNREF